MSSKFKLFRLFKEVTILIWIWLILWLLMVPIYIAWPHSRSSDRTVLETVRQMLQSHCINNFINFGEARSLTNDSCISFKWVIIPFIFGMPNIYSSLGSNSIQGSMHGAHDIIPLKHCGPRLGQPCWLGSRCYGELIYNRGSKGSHWKFNLWFRGPTHQLGALCGTCNILAPLTSSGSCLF